jgi:two-component system CheB/CheR fusion protein
MTDSSPSDAGSDDAALQEDSEDSGRLFVAGLGASAGGLRALEGFFAHAPTDGGVAYVVVSHQHPGQTSLLPELIAKHTSLPVVRAEDGTAIEPDTVYLPPPGTHMGVSGGTLRALEIPEGAAARLPVDSLFRSLAAGLGHRAIGVVLSGTGTDGTEGIRAIKGEAGLTLAQDDGSADFSGMPRSATATGLVDLVLPPESMPERLTSYVKGLQQAVPSPSGLEFPQPVYDRVLLLLRQRTGHDFSAYKDKTLRRRLERRIRLHDLETLRDYLVLVQKRPEELDLLFQEFLIGVTSFFREPEAFLALAGGIEELLKEKPDDYQLRVWVPGCSTGEEAYSIVMTLRECLDQQQRPLTMQVFATDINPQAIDVARRGRYAAGIAADIPGERLSRWFTENDGRYEISKSIREQVIFAPQDVLADPPFTKLDLISCRNLLIYLQSEVQRRLLPMFHYALKPDGILFLGSSETTSGFEDLFVPIDKKWKVYRRGADSHARLPSVSLRHQREAQQPAISGETVGVSALADRHLLEAHCPPSVLVNAQGEILHVRGRTGFCLEPSQGRPNMNVLNMAREGLAPDLAIALREANSNRVTVSRRVRVKTNSTWNLVDLQVEPVDRQGLRGTLLVTFREVPSPEAPEPEQSPEAVRSAGADPLEWELARAKQHLQATVEELEASNEELKSTNEELQSTNEELQSTNEELETSKEELQSLNEELQTVNAELQEKISDLSRANDDMTNLLNSTDIATVFLDDELRIKRFTPQAKAIFQLIETDVGRPITDLASQLRYLYFESDAREVIRTLVSKKLELQTESGAYYLTRIMPYRTADNRLDGLVVTFVDTTLAQGARSLARQIAEAVGVPVLVLNQDQRVTSANSSFCELFDLSLDQTVGKAVHELWVGQQLREALERLGPSGQLCSYEFHTTLPQKGPAAIRLSARRLEAPTQFVLSFRLVELPSEGA